LHARDLAPVHFWPSLHSVLGGFKLGVDAWATPEPISGFMNFLSCAERRRRASKAVRSTF